MLLVITCYPILKNPYFILPALLLSFIDIFFSKYVSLGLRIAFFSYFFTIYFWQKQDKNLSLSTFLFVSAFSFLTIDYQFFQSTLLAIYFIFVISPILKNAYYILRLNEFSATEKELKFNTFKEQTLKNQLKPHFLFNLLSTIDARYLENQKEGEELLLDLKKLVRKTDVLVRKETVGFLEEISLVNDMVSLIGKSKNTQYHLIQEFETTDFKIIPLSIEPLVENAIKYSKIESKPDGFIKIHSYQKGKRIYIDIDDNGIGFDHRNLKISVGISNTKKRFEQYHNGTFYMESKANEGCHSHISFNE